MLRDRFLFWGQKQIEKGSWFLAPFSWVYAVCIWVRNTLYDWNLLKIEKVKPVVVSVGNIFAGGTGKTPFVHLLAKTFSHKKVAILSRGYGEMPDEAMFLAKRLPNARICVGKNRALIAKYLNVDLIILDDGFQHRKLHRDFDIVLDHKGKRRYLPWGFLRDSPQRLQKVDAVFEIGKDFKMSVRRIWDAKGNEISSIQGWKVVLFCGIARPERFKKTVEDLGAEVIEEIYFADHEKAHNLPKANALICTEKDFVKLENADLPIYYLEMELLVAAGKEPWENLVEKIAQKIDNKML